MTRGVGQHVRMREPTGADRRAPASHCANAMHSRITQMQRRSLAKCNGMRCRIGLQAMDVVAVVEAAADRKHADAMMAGVADVLMRDRDGFRNHACADQRFGPRSPDSQTQAGEQEGLRPRDLAIT